MLIKKAKWGLIGVFVIALLLRLLMMTWAVHPDLITQAGWGKWIYDNGWFGFYENEVWRFGGPNHPPLINLVYSLGFKIHEWLLTGFLALGNFIALNRLGASKILWFYDFILWFGSKFYTDTPFLWGQLVSMKLIVIAADLILGGMIYKITLNKANKKTALGLTALYLLSPFAWYESSFWGQNDQLGLVFLLTAFWLLCKNKWSWLATIVLAVSIGLKPTAFIFCPLFLWFAMKNKKRFWGAAAGGLAALLLYYWLVSITTAYDFVTFNINLQKQIFVKGEIWTWISTFNFWRLITEYETNYSDKLLGINYKTLGYLVFLGINMYAFVKFKARDWWSSLRAIFVVGFGGWLFMAAMHERYLYTAVVTGLILCAENIKMLKYWIGLSLIFWLNMFTGWWMPESLGKFKDILTWGNYNDAWVPKLLSLFNLGIFAKMTKMVKEGSRK